MRNAEILRMAKALLTPLIVSNDSPSSSDSSDGSGSGSGNGIGSGSGSGGSSISLVSLVDVSNVSKTASTTIMTVDVEDPHINERLRILLETTVRLLYPKGLLAGEDLPAPAYPLVGEGEFPLPDSLAAAAAYHTAWLLTGETKLASAFEEAMEIYYTSLEACVAPIVRKH